jgi:hypothetical protein
MSDLRGVEDEGPVVPDVLAIDEVAVGTGASIVIAVAATLAVLLAVLVATLSGASAAPRQETSAAWTASDPVSPPARGEYRVADRSAPARDGVYQVVSPAPRPEKSVAMVVVAGLFLAMSAATSVLWRALGRSVVGAGRRSAPARIRGRG